MTNIEHVQRHGKPALEWEDSAGHPCAAYIGTVSDRLRIGRDSRYTAGPLDLDAEGARAVARVLLRWAETGDLGRVNEGEGGRG